MVAHDGDNPMAAISELASGEATREEVVSALRKHKVDALDLLVEMIGEQQAARRNRNLVRPFSASDVQPASRRSKRTGPPHQQPRLPFLLNGTLYDPADVTRFNETDLDFVAAGDKILTFDDRSIVDNWLQTSLLTSAMASSDEATLSRFTEPGTVSPTSVDGPGKFTSGGWVPVPVAPPVPHTNFYEHINFEGDRFEVGEDLACNDLTQASMGWFSGSWNDQISSVQFVRTQWAVLGEHVNFDGSRLVLHWQQNASNLVTWGWNDRASAVLTAFHTPAVPAVGIAWYPPYTPWHP